MADMDLIRAMTEIGKSKQGTEPYDSTAQVVRVEGNTAWVHLPGGVDETPVQMTVNATVGDSVQVRVADGTAWIVGNATAPPTDDRVANVAKDSADVAKQTADTAREEAKKAASTATTYITDIDEDGVMVHPDGDSTTGWRIADALELLKSGVAYIKAWVEDGIAKVRVGREDAGHTVIDANGMRVYGSDGTVQLANVGYGEGASASGTATAPYYTFGTRRTTTDVYDATKTYEIGDLVLYGNPSKMYVCHTAITTPEGWTDWKWQLAIGNWSVAEGREIVASGVYSVAEGYGTKAIGTECHAEGQQTVAGNGTGMCSHAEGQYSTAHGSFSHAQNLQSIAERRAQTALGTYNEEDPISSRTTHPGGNVDYGQHAVIVGNGTSNSNRSNALTVDWNGDVWAAGEIEDGNGNKLSDISNLIAVNQFNVFSSQTIPAGGTVAQTSVNIARSGYTPLAIRGIDITNNNVYAYYWHITGDTLVVSVKNGGSSSVTCSCSAYIAYIKDI